MTNYELKSITIPFACPTAQHGVEIQETKKVFQRGGEQVPIPAGTTCSNVERCAAVTTHHANGSSSYTWAKCAYVNSAAAA